MNNLRNYLITVSSKLWDRTNCIQLSKITDNSISFIIVPLNFGFNLNSNFGLNIKTF